MSSPNARPAWGASSSFTARVVLTLERFLHIEAVSGGVLIAAAALALLWANSPWAHSYEALWHLPVSVGVGSITTSQTLHFVVNDCLMTIFFLVAGLEIRRELHEGALSDLRSAALPIVAAVGGVLAPALIYLAFNATTHPEGWAVPIATDIAFAIGVLALLGRSIPSGVRVLLLALAIIDDIAAVLVIALVYSHDLHWTGAWIALSAIAIVLLLQRFGIRTAIAYVAPGALLWYGLWHLGVHPTLAGVILGLLTPAVPLADRSLADEVSATLANTAERVRIDGPAHQDIVSSIGTIHTAHRDLLPPVVSVQSALHGWVAYGIMPLFALANAGVAIDGLEFTSSQDVALALGIGVGLLVGKPLGIFAVSWLSIRLGICSLPQDVGWRGLWLIAVLGGIGFTMSIFIAALAFTDPALLANAKLAVLVASALAAMTGLILGKLLFRQTLSAA